ncbi:unnamed protein product [Schistocephalus solidus]|uniref:Reverse transcriptase domain-containing protein n=1 Tax=Schistocephalus solidus TaxID=70667 RepID=A0A183SL32_SCHSO|nr:unnamed protein product [Schistocephalus solidus]
MPDITGLDYVTDCAPLLMPIRGSRTGQFNPFSSPTTDAEYRSSKNKFHVLKNCVEAGFELTSSSTHLEQGLLLESQRGFRRHCCNTDLIFAARQLQEKCQEMHTHIYSIFVDLTKAFYTVNLEGL